MQNCISGKITTIIIIFHRPLENFGYCSLWLSEKHGESITSMKWNREILLRIETEIHTQQIFLEL